jgi:hypothetical protein
MSPVTDNNIALLSIKHPWGELGHGTCPGRLFSLRPRTPRTLLDQSHVCLPLECFSLYFFLSRNAGSGRRAV